MESKQPFFSYAGEENAEGVGDICIHDSVPSPTNRTRKKGERREKSVWRRERGGRKKGERRALS